MEMNCRRDSSAHSIRLPQYPRCSLLTRQGLLLPQDGYGQGAALESRTRAALWVNRENSWNDMFERYTEKARRVIFFARYEASQYGSPQIETEHLLLGLAREDQSLLRMFLGDENIGNIRVEIEQHITRQQMISTSVEVPLTNESKKVLTLASDEARRLNHRHVGTAHMLLGMLGVEDSLAARLLQAKGLKAEVARERMREERSNVGVAHGRVPTGSWGGPSAALHGFLNGLKSLNSDALIDFFAENVRFIDTTGRNWNHEEISKNCETLFAQYAKKNSAAVVEDTFGADNFFIASVLWRNAVLASEQRAWVHRMSIALIWENEDWRILLMHVTPVQVP
jgi:hypothetical protein